MPINVGEFKDARDRVKLKTKSVFNNWVMTIFLTQKFKFYVCDLFFEEPTFNIDDFLMENEIR